MNKNVLFIFFILISTSLFAQKILTLEESIKIALQRNSNLIKSQNSLTYRDAVIKSNYGNLLPDLGVRGNWNWQRISDKGGQKQIDFFGIERITEATQTDNRNYSLSAGGSVILFDGLANYARISQSKDEYESAELNLMKLKQDIVLTTTNLFYAVISTKELVKVREDNLAFNQKLLETIEERNRLGSVAVADVYTQQVSVGNAQLLLIQSENAYESSKNNFLNYLALDIFDDYELADPMVEISEEDDKDLLEHDSKLELLVANALDNRYDYKSQKLTLSAAEKGKTISQSGLFPSLSGNYSYSTSGIKPDKLFDRGIYSVGLSLNIPIFSNWNTEASMQFAEVNKLNEMENLSVLERTIKIEVKNSYLDLLASKKQLEVSRSNIIAAKENRRVNNERYNLGSGTILDVLQSDKNYTQALTDNISAKFEYYTNRDKLLNALGRLDFNKYQ